MRALARLIIVLALAIALPVQAMSAVTGGICMAGQHGDAHAHDHAPDGAADHDHDGTGTPADASHCPPCAACCASAAIAATPLAAPVWTAHAAVNVPAAPLPLGELPSLPDRPPLSS